MFNFCGPRQQLKLTFSMEMDKRYYKTDDRSLCSISYLAILQLFALELSATSITIPSPSMWQIRHTHLHRHKHLPFNSISITELFPMFGSPLSNSQVDLAQLADGLHHHGYSNTYVLLFSCKKNSHMGFQCTHGPRLFVWMLLMQHRVWRRN